MSSAGQGFSCSPGWRGGRGRRPGPGSGLGPQGPTPKGLGLDGGEDDVIVLRL
ncbi:hypothetical protein BZL30_5939 [Mycobacterium kansasii]|uniref:Uncharacterized protein n=1 Tax=Mycobacterium kansasii TaxID=1768 RepID=A0A1V3WYH1_MYCKA|nr:hypothetical protein BZL30_5939 [Mycobacterium kansasii]